MSTLPSKAGWIRSLLEHHEGALIRYAARITSDAERARDVVQDTFLRLCKAIEGGKEPGEFGGHEVEWLYTVCRNRALDVCRKENRMRTMGENGAENCESRTPLPVESLERRETQNQVLGAIETLPRNQREVILLKFQNGLSYKEISHITDLTITNVGYLIHVGLKAVRHKLKVPPLATKAYRRVP